MSLNPFAPLSESPSERALVSLPTDYKLRGSLESLGITWLNPPNSSSLFAKALLPKGWTVKASPPFPLKSKIVTIFNEIGQEQIKMWITKTRGDESAMVSFPERGSIFRSRKDDPLNQQRKIYPSYSIRPQVIFKIQSCVAPFAAQTVAYCIVAFQLIALMWATTRSKRG